MQAGSWPCPGLFVGVATTTSELPTAFQQCMSIQHSCKWPENETIWHGEGKGRKSHYYSVYTLHFKTHSAIICKRSDRARARFFYIMHMCQQYTYQNVTFLLNYYNFNFGASLDIENAYQVYIGSPRLPPMLAFI